MERLYCPECGDYLEGGDGSMVDCHCGWKQERSLSSDEDEIEQLRQRVAELEKERDRLSELCDKWNFECDDMREDNNRLANEANAMKQQRDDLLAALEKLTDVLANIGITSGLYDDEQDALKAACEAIASVKEKA